MSTPIRQQAGNRARRRLAGAGTGLVLLALLTGPLALLVHERWTPLLRLDTGTTRSAEQLVEGTTGLLVAARLLTHLGDPLLVNLGVLVLIAVLLVRGARRLALYVLVVRVGALLLSGTVKLAVARARPVFELPVSSAAGYSFPSGHALGSSAFYLSAAVVLLPAVRRSLRRWLLAAAVLIPLLVATTRVLLGVHYLSDVVAGLLLGFGWAAVCTTVFALWRRDEGRRVDPYDEGLQPEFAGG